MSKRETAIRTLAVVGLGSLIAILIASWYFQSPQLNPLKVWHGANMGVRSILSGSSSNEHPLGVKDLQTIKQVVSRERQIATTIKSFDQARLINMPQSIKNQAATNRTRAAKLERDAARLSQINKQLREGRVTLNALQQDYSEALVYQQIEAARRQEVDEVLQQLEAPEQLPVQEPRSRSSRVERGIPSSVLDNVQQSTGISPEEINALLNQ